MNEWVKWVVVVSSLAGLTGGLVRPVQAAPGEVTGLSLQANTQLLSWTTAPDGAVYEVLRGSLQQLPVGPGGSDETCFGPTSGTSFGDFEVPAPGQGFWYLVRAVDHSGAGTYGVALPSGQPRATTTCGGACPEPGSLFRGKLQYVIVVLVPAGARSDVLAHASEFEALGYQVATDGSTLTGPPRPVAGWSVTLGNSTAVTQANGDFFLDHPPGSPAQGQIFHPTEELTAAYTFSDSQLVRPCHVPAPIVLPIEFEGPCAMNDPPEQAPAGCHPPTAAHRHDTGPVPLLIPGQTTGAIPKTIYPAGNQQGIGCQYMDGPAGLPGTEAWQVILNYVNSTCDKRVSAGCCPNETGTLGSLINHVSCVNNHKGRYCQELEPADMAVDVLGTTIYAQEYSSSLSELLGIRSNFSVTKTVFSGSLTQFKVHNNGCFGTTSVMTWRHEVGGVLRDVDNNLLSGPPDYASKTLKHYAPAATYGAYITDATVKYYAPPTCPANANNRDMYFLTVDGYDVIVTFKCTPARGACCLPGGVPKEPETLGSPGGCAVLSPAFCAQIGGVYRGDGTTCGPGGACP